MENVRYDIWSVEKLENIVVYWLYSIWKFKVFLIVIECSFL